jgi:hypothetical protein
VLWAIVLLKACISVYFEGLFGQGRKALRGWELDAGQGYNFDSVEQEPEPEREGDVVMASMPKYQYSTTSHASHSAPLQQFPSLHRGQLSLEDGAEMVGPPKTHAGAPYLPNEVGLDWRTTLRPSTSIQTDFRTLLSHHKEVWLAAA